MPPSPTPATSPAPAAFKQMGLTSAVAIGIGGMVGGGVYPIFGSAAKVVGSAMWLSFLAGGMVALHLI